VNSQDKKYLLSGPVLDLYDSVTTKLLKYKGILPDSMQYDIFSAIKEHQITETAVKKMCILQIGIYVCTLI
jgi:hypothetical protein